MFAVMSSSRSGGNHARRAPTCTRSGRRLPNGASSTRVLDDERLSKSLTDRLRERVVRHASRRELDDDGEGRFLLHAGPCGRTRMWPLSSRPSPLTTSRTADGEDVDTANDQHVVGAPDAPHARGGAPTRTGAGSNLDVVARAEAEERRRSVAGGGSGRARRWRRRRVDRRAGLGVDQLGVDEAAGAEVHPVLCHALPHRETPMSPTPIASVTRAPQPASNLGRKAGSPPPGSPATRTRATVDPARSKPRSAATSTGTRRMKG